MLWLNFMKAYVEYTLVLGAWQFEYYEQDTTGRHSRGMYKPCSKMPTMTEAWIV